MSQPTPIALEDGSQLTREAWHFLESEAKELGMPDLRVTPVTEFLAAVSQDEISLADRQTIIDQAILIFDHLYPHMPFKTDIYGFVHPSDFLRQEVQPVLSSLREIEFHTRMITAFSLVRDAHTLYGLPSPYRGAAAFLPFQMHPLLDPKAGWRFVVTSVMNTRPDGGFGHPFFGPGAELVGWGDHGILAHVERVESHLPGGNYFASFARGAMHSTLRPLAFVQLPFDDEMPTAIIRYRPLGSSEIHSIGLPWAVGTGFGGAPGFPNSAFSLSPATALANRCGAMLHHRQAMRHDRKVAESRDPRQTSTIPQMFEFQYTGGPRSKGFIHSSDLKDRGQPGARFGYIRIIAFSDGSSAPGATDRIVEEFRRIVTLMDQVAPDGLIIDIRGNPGGDVQAAERMLQMLTAQQIEPAHFHLANTPVMQDILRSLKTSTAAELSESDSVKLSAALAELQAWLDETEQTPFPEGSRLTAGRPLTEPHSANEIGQVYHGRGVALLVNSLTYSAADIFAAGFQDHAIGPILGTSLLTGGGGANVWSHGELMNKVGPRPGIPLASLPADSSMSLAIRRSSRVRNSEGQPVEDQAVNVDIFYFTDSVDDLIAGNPRLIHRACQQFKNKPAFRIDAGEPVLRADGGLTISVQTVNIASLQFFLNNHLALTAAPTGGAPQTFSIPALSEVPAPRVLRIEGYAPDNLSDGATQLVRARTIGLPEPAIPDSFDPATGSITGTDSGGFDTETT